MKNENKFFLFFFLMLLAGRGAAQTVSIDHVAGPIVLNEPVFDSTHQLNLVRGLFADVLVKNNSVWTTYQIASDTTLSFGKGLWYKKFDRNLGLLQGQSMGINVFADTTFSNDLGDHQITYMNDTLYIVALIVGHGNGAGVFKYDTTFNKISGPVYVGDSTTDACLDMGIGNDGTNIYTQFYHVPLTCSIPECWGAKLYKLNAALDVLDSNVVDPGSGTFVTGTSIVHVPNGQMGATQDKLQIFSTNRDYGNALTVGIHTFASDMNLQYISGSPQTIIEEDLDTYWPCGVSWNQAHQLWVVGYTKEVSDTIFPNEEIGPSYLKIFDPAWNLVDSFQLNLGNNAFRVMTETEGDDIYVVYDEMPFLHHTVTVSACKIEHFRISVSSGIMDGPGTEDRIELFPNPASDGRFSIRTNSRSPITVSIYDQQLKLIEQYERPFGNTGSFMINRKGLFVVHVRTRDAVMVKKLIAF